MHVKVTHPVPLFVPGLLRKPTLQAATLVPWFQYFAMMCHAIQQRGGHFGITEHLRPFPEVQVGCDDERDLLIEFGDGMEQQLAAVAREGLP